MQNDPHTLWHRAERLFQSDPLQASVAYSGLLDDPELAAAAHLRLSLLTQRSGDMRQSVGHALAAHQACPPDPDMLAMLCKRLFTLGEIPAAIACASEPCVRDSQDVTVVAELGKLMTDAFQPALALTLLQRARQLGLDSPGLSYLIGLSQMYCGQLDAAEKAFEHCLGRDPDFARAHWALSKLRRAGADHHHVQRLRAALAKVGAASQDLPLLQYALFKELDDLGQVDAAWHTLAAGMRTRRAQVRYDHAQEQALFDHLLTMQVARIAPARAQDVDGPIPIFIVGMPRSGTTVLERILANHPDVADAGELHDFVLQLRWMCNRAGGPYLDLDLARRTAQTHWEELGARYLSHTRFHARARAYYTDKMPANFLNVGYIAQALPQARIVHMVRDGMDTCFSNLKELFAGAYPHSYDQIEMADHYLNYRRLMGHWHTLFPGRILDVSYEALVARPDAVAAELLAFCGLPPASHITDIGAGTVTTASSVQVRGGIHAGHVAQWRRYADHLIPMQQRLAAAPP